MPTQSGRGASTGPADWRVSWTEAGLELRQREPSKGPRVTDTILVPFVSQLSDDGYLIERGDLLMIAWDAFYDATQLPAYADLAAVLQLPHTTDARISLRSRGALTDATFSIAVSGWIRADGRLASPELVGPVMTDGGLTEMMDRSQWQLFASVVDFSKRPAAQRHDGYQRQCWGRIRSLALQARAHLDDFLHRSVVLTPETLDIGLRRSEDITVDTVIEIEPRFAEAPSGWLSAFDRSPGVRDRYDIRTAEGTVQVLISPGVRSVLEEIKRLPGRRAAGARAQAFILNPYATLGESAKDVIVEHQFEAAREAAGLHYERFVPVFERDLTGYPLRIGLLVESAGTSGPLSSETEWLSDDDLELFVQKVEACLSNGYPLIAWQGFDLEIQGDTRDYLAALKEALRIRQTGPAVVSYATVHDLSGYSSRVEAIGFEKPYFSPYIARRNDGEGWFPDNVVPFVVYPPDAGSESIAIPLSPRSLQELEVATRAARAEGADQVIVSWLPRPMPFAEAENITKTFEAALDDIKRGTFEPAARAEPNGEGTGKRKSLILRANIESVDYEEHRRTALQAFPRDPEVPRALRSDLPMLPHQRAGLAWMQHLFEAREEHQVRGAVLADDMGLGKTLQLLAFMAWLVERSPTIEPMLVVAPVSLLENWRDECDKFLAPGALPMLTAYGDGLVHLRVPRAQVDERLRVEDGLVRFLKPGWVGTARVVLTTYETLRDLEFSFALQKWSIMVCDEAQRIKNPATMVTRAAKKQNVIFRVACTGTPVENTLADLWCLFDFVQPGLLGALNDFGQRYRRPIEARTDEERTRVEELRLKIAPQLIRRMKHEVAKDLPKKIISSACRLPISPAQRNLYARAIEDFKRRADPDVASPFKNHLGLLQYLRLLCTDPRRHGLGVFTPEPLPQYRVKSPKLDWLLKQLAIVRRQDEKVIVFCEFRNIQRLLQHYIQEELSYRPDIINGDTSASASHVASRQKRIKKFQAEPGFGVIILSPLAVGFGVNIQAANHVVHYTRTWNPAKEDQATDRAYRIGQKKDVHVYYPIVTAEDFSTFDVKLDELLTSKRALAHDMLNGTGDIGPGEFDIADVVPEASRAGLEDMVTLDMAAQMDWKHFECLAQTLWSKRGFLCYQTPSSGDNGVDLVAIRGDEGELLQSKASGAPGAQLSWDAVKEVVAGAALYEKRHPGVRFTKVCLTNQFFSPQAHENAALHSVKIIEGPGLAHLLGEHPVSLVDVERIRYGRWDDIPDSAG
jgi:hypothetical protein